MATRRAGQLRTRIHLQARSISDDGFGNPVSGPFETKHLAWAKFQYLRGGEEVMAGRLAGKQPAIILIRRRDFASQEITTAWRIIGNDGALWNIRAITDPDDKGAWLEILAEKGVAT